ncbi:MAG: hypothetical protein KJO07_11340 [Deltaproteobacteria bacterium]|nr:hypothetical protein [Deltaproteobacteria bacterium]
MKRLTVLFTAAAALALMGCGDNLEPGTGLGPQQGPDPITKLPPATDVPPAQPFPQAISFETPACNSIGGCETVTFCPNGVGNYEPPNGTTGGGDFVYGVGEDAVWGINSDFAYTFEYKPGGTIASPLGNVLLPGIANIGLCDTLETNVGTRSPLQIADDDQFDGDELDENMMPIANLGSRPTTLPDLDD